MKRLSGLLLGLAILAVNAASPAMAEDCGGPVTADEALASEDARYAAQMGDDYGSLQKLLGADLVYIHSSAGGGNKASFIDSMKFRTLHNSLIRRRDLTVPT